MAKSRRLRARRPSPPPRLLEHGEFGTHDPPELQLAGRTDDAPMTLLRLGATDLERGVDAIRNGACPSAVVTGFGERADVIARARRATRELGVPWLTDPLVFLTALPGYRTSRHLKDLDYAPGRDSEPYGPREFDDLDLTRRVGRAVVGAQMDIGASGAWAGSFTLSGMTDPWLPIDQRLIRIGTDAGRAWGSPVIAAVPLRLMGFDSTEAQRLLVRALSACKPDAWLLMMDGVSESSSAERMVAALRLVLLLQVTNAPVIVGRSGDLRRFFWAFGVRGTEVGLGRLLRFYVPDYRKRSRGPGPTPGPRFEFPSLCCSLGQSNARDLLGAEVVPETNCGCPVCTLAYRRRLVELPGRIHRDGGSVPQYTGTVGARGAAARTGLQRPPVVGAMQWQRVGSSTERKRLSNASRGRLASTSATYARRPA
jgi:hypothetical protein